MSEAFASNNNENPSARAHKRAAVALAAGMAAGGAAAEGSTPPEVPQPPGEAYNFTVDQDTLSKPTSVTKNPDGSYSATAEILNSGESEALGDIPIDEPLSAEEAAALEAQYKVDSPPTPNTTEDVQEDTEKTSISYWEWKAQQAENALRNGPADPFPNTNPDMSDVVDQLNEAIGMNESADRVREVLNEKMIELAESNPRVAGLLSTLGNAAVTGIMTRWSNTVEDELTQSLEEQAQYDPNAAAVYKDLASNKLDPEAMLFGKTLISEDGKSKLSIGVDADLSRNPNPRVGFNYRLRF